MPYILDNHVKNYMELLRCSKKKEDYQNINKVFCLVFLGICLSLLSATPMLLIFTKSSTSVPNIGAGVGNQHKVNQLHTRENEKYTYALKTYTTTRSEFNNFSSVPNSNAFTISTLLDFKNLLQSMSVNENIILTVDITEDFRCETEKILNGTQKVTVLNIVGHVNEDSVTCLLNHFQSVENLTLVDEDDCSAVSHSFSATNIVLERLKSLSLESDIMCENVFEFIYKRTSLPYLQTISIINGRITDAMCKFLGKFLNEYSQNLESISFVKTTWATACFSDPNFNVKNIKGVKQLRLDILSSVQRSKQYITDVLRTFPELQEFKALFGYVSSNQLAYVSSFSNLRSLSLNVRLEEHSFDVGIFRQMFPFLEVLFLELFFDGTQGNAMYSVNGYHEAKTILKDFSVNSNHHYEKN